MTRKSQGSFYDMLPQEKKDELRAAYKAAVATTHLDSLLLGTSG
jgi:hypothetical protein